MLSCAFCSHRFFFSKQVCVGIKLRELTFTFMVSFSETCLSSLVSHTKVSYIDVNLRFLTWYISTLSRHSLQCIIVKTPIYIQKLNYLNEQVTLVRCRYISNCGLTFDAVLALNTLETLLLTSWSLLRSVAFSADQTGCFGEDSSFRWITSLERHLPASLLD